MIYRDEYEEFKKELLQDPGKPFTFHATQTAREFFAELVQEYPQARFYAGDSVQYVCMNSKAAQGLARKLKNQKQEQEKALQETMALLESVKGGEAWK